MITNGTGAQPTAPPATPAALPGLPPTPGIRSAAAPAAISGRTLPGPAEVGDVPGGRTRTPCAAARAGSLGYRPRVSTLVHPSRPVDVPALVPT